MISISWPEVFFGIWLAQALIVFQFMRTMLNWQRRQDRMISHLLDLKIEELGKAVVKECFKQSEAEVEPQRYN